MDRLRAAHAHDLPLLEDAQQIGLGLQADIGDLVQENRAAHRGFELALLAVLRAGEGALLVAEQLAFDQGLRQRAAVDHHERVVAPRAQAVDGAGHQFLSGAAFALDQHGGIDSGHRFDLLAHVAHRVAHADQLAERVVFGQLLPQQPVLPFQPVLLQRVARHHRKVVRVERLGDVIEGAVLEGAHGRFHRSVPGHHDHAGVELLGANLLQQLDAIHTRHADVGDHQVEFAPGQLR